MRKLLLILLAALCVIAVGCQKEDEKTPVSMENQPKVEEPEAEEPKAEEPKAEEPEVEEPKVEEPEAEEPKAEEPKAEEPKAEEPEAEEPKVEEPKVEEPEAEEPKVEEPKVEEPKVEEPKVEEPKAEEPKVEEPKVEEPKEEEPKVTVTPIEQVPIETFEMPEKKQWENHTFGNPGDKTVAEQRQEIQDAMTLAINTEVVWKEVPKFNPTQANYTHIKAITYDCLSYRGQKTKTFAYIGFPEGASAENPVPAVLLVPGGGGHPMAEWVRIWNEKGYAAICMEVTGFFPEIVNAGITEGTGGYVHGLTEDFAEEGYISTPQRVYPTSYAEVEEHWAYHGLSQVILANNLMRQDERVDKNNIGITGISWGGVTVSQVIGYDTRYSFAIPIYGTAYMGDEMRSFANFANDYVDALWAAERNLDNAKMPIFWFTYNDDNNFGVPSYVKSYQHTQGYNPKNTLLMLGNWGHSHSSGWSKPQSYLFADWVTFGKDGFVTFVTQPKGREVNCRVNIPEETGSVVAYVYYIEEPMSYSAHDKFNRGVNYVYLDQKWKNTRSWLTVDRENGVVSGTIPDNVSGYYIQLMFKTENTKNYSSSIYVELD